MMYWRYLWYVLRHKWFVLVAGVRLGEIPLRRLIIHDMSKFSRAEFGPYARKFWGKDEPGADIEKIEQEFAAAWLHHENLNPHHWGYWIARSGCMAGKPLKMPRAYVHEMVADWHGAGRTINGSWDMSGWLKNNVYNIGKNLHPESLKLVAQLLGEMGYFFDMDKLKE